MRSPVANVLADILALNAGPHASVRVCPYCLVSFGRADPGSTLQRVGLGKRGKGVVERLVVRDRDVWAWNVVDPDQPSSSSVCWSWPFLSTNTGVSAIISPEKKIQQRAPQFEPHALAMEVYAHQGATLIRARQLGHRHPADFYRRWVDLFRRRGEIPGRHN